MTDMQVKARANELKEQELAIKEQEMLNARQQAITAQQRADEEARANRMDEALKEAEAHAKYSAVDYLGPSYTESGGYKKVETPQNWVKAGKDIISGFLNPFGALINLLK